MPPFVPKSPHLLLLRLCAAVRPFSAAASVSGGGGGPEKLARIADELLALSKTEREDYAALFRLRLGLDKFVPAGGVPAIAGGASPAAAAAEAVEVKEKTAFDIKLEKFDAAAKIKIIKEVRTFTDLGLKEAKELVEKAPVVLKNGVSKEEAEAIAKKLKEVGATVVLE